MKILVAGWFSFASGHATAGDLMARDVVRDWLRSAGLSCDVAIAPPFTGGVDLDGIAPTDYTHLVFVCGPFERGKLEMQLLERFRHCRIIGLNLSMAEPLDRWNPFDLLIERDSSEGQHPDLVFVARQPRVPVVGVCLVEPHAGAATAEAEAAIQRLIASRPAAVVSIDTRLDENATGLRDPQEVESLIARMDLLITTRLHGTVLALKNGVPVIAIDTIPGGAKIQKQAETVGWRTVFTVDELTDEALQRAFDDCLTTEARDAARACADRASRALEEIRASVVRALLEPAALDEAARVRLAQEASEPADAVVEDRHPGGWRGRFARLISRRRLAPANTTPSDAPDSR